MIWVLVANTNSCCIYDYEKKSQTLTLTKEMKHPESKLKSSDLVSDAPGHYSVNGGTHGAFFPHEEPQKIEIENFSREIAKELDAGRRDNRYTNLIVMVSPHMNGLIHQHLNKHVKDFIMLDIKKDYTHLTENEMLNVLKKELHHHF